jgi:hypothetical protein
MKKVKFKNTELTRVKVVNNILRIYDKSEAIDRFDWYSDAHYFCIVLAKEYGLKVSTVSGVVAALSPLRTWEQNKLLAISLINSGTCGHMGTFVGKARAILENDYSNTDEKILGMLGGQKICSFYLNILYPNSAQNITIDRHALSISLGYWITEEDYRGITPNQYAFFSQCFVVAAAKRNIHPLLMQSSTWVIWRKIKKDYAKIK